MTKNLKKFLFLVLCCLFLLSSCSYNMPANKNTTTDVENNVTNNITENTVTIGDINIDDLEEALVIASTKVMGACLGVKRAYETSLSGINYEQAEATGSGVIYKRVENYNENSELTSYTYYVVTNRHVVKGSDETKVYHYYAYLGDNEKEIEMKLLGYDEKVDIACLTFEDIKYFEPVEFGDSSALSACQFAFAVGCPEGFTYFNSVTFGVISSPLRYLSDDTDDDGVNDFNFEYIQHDVSINPGNSGGGLFNIAGELIGINTMKLVSSDIENMGFSIPSNIVKILLEDYLEEGLEILRPRLGVTGYEVIELTDIIISRNSLQSIPNIYNGLAPYGLYVASVVSEGTISGTDITKDDIILEIDGLKISRNYYISTKFNSLIDYKVGDKIEITYYDRSSDTIKVTEAILSNK